MDNNEKINDATNRVMKALKNAVLKTPDIAEFEKYESTVREEWEDYFLDLLNDEVDYD